jgi:hypothetical protein
MEEKLLKIINSKPSAYRSMKMAQYGLIKKTPKTEEALRRWKLEQWLNLNALLLDPPQVLPCGKKYKNQKSPTVCRPSKRINEKTPTPMAYDLTREQILEAIHQKMQGKRVLWRYL